MTLQQYCNLLVLNQHEYAEAMSPPHTCFVKGVSMQADDKPHSRLLLVAMDKCQRCTKSVYPAEKMGPVREAVFHKQCFKCVVCNQYLTMKTFNTNEQEAGDKEIYCATHKPKTRGNAYGINSMSIRTSMHVQGHLKVTKLFYAKHHYLSFVVSPLTRFSRNTIL